jgi:hypothetical protein
MGSMQESEWAPRLRTGLAMAGTPLDEEPLCAGPPLPADYR